MAAPSFIALAMSALLVSCCVASRDVPLPAGGGEILAARVPHFDPSCIVMVPCNLPDCTQYCYNIGLQQKGFCTAKPDMNFYCCCPVGSN